MDDSIYERARDSYVAGDFREALKLLDALIERPTDEGDRAGALYLRARGHEDGCFADGVQYERALSDYRELMNFADENGPLGVVLLGYARTLYLQDASSNADEILRTCERAATEYRNVSAMMLAGLVLDRYRGAGRLGRRLYVKALLRGIPSALDYVADSYMREGRTASAQATLLLSKMVSPLAKFIHGDQAPLFHQ